MQTQKLNPALTIQRVEGGFPHSEILGSKLVRSSPRLIAAYHVLHRLSAPRHPPDALTTLDYSYDRCPLGKDRTKIQERPAFDLSIEDIACRIHPAHAAAGRGWFAGTRMPCLPNVFPLYDVKHPRRALKGAQHEALQTFRTQTNWWSQTGSNRRPPECKSGALPAELWPRVGIDLTIMVGLGRLERPTSPLSGVRSNHLSYRP